MSVESSFSDYYSQSFWVVRMLDISAEKKMQTRERKLRPKPEGIKIKLEPVIFGSIQRSLTWGPWTIRGGPWMDGWGFKKLMKSQELCAKCVFLEKGSVDFTDSPK